MTRGLILSLFPGIDLLGRAFEAAGWSVVWGPDLIYARDIRGWHVPPGRFDGVIGGPPCQFASPLSNIVRAVHGDEAVAPDQIPEFARVVAEARPRWWLMECSDRAYAPEVEGYLVEQFWLSPRDLGDPQSRRRLIALGWKKWAHKNSAYRRFDAPKLTNRLPLVALECVEHEPAVTSQCRPVPSGSGKVKRTHPRHPRSVLPSGGRTKRHLGDSLRIQGWPDLDLSHWLTATACKMVGNGVPRVMGEAIANAIAQWEDESR